jgi:Zn-dependent oligopeptidase
LHDKFAENVLDATKRFEKLIVDKNEIEGLPATVLGLAAEKAKIKVRSSGLILFFSCANLIEPMLRFEFSNTKTQGCMPNVLLDCKP